MEAPAHDSPQPKAMLRLPDGGELQLPLLIDAAGATFIDIRKLQPETGARSALVTLPWFHADSADKAPLRPCADC